MDTKYSVYSGDIVHVQITSSNDEKSIPSGKTFSKRLTIKDIKDKLEVQTGACSSTMKIQVYDCEDKLQCELDDDAKLLGSYPVDNGMRFHVEDTFALRKMLEDESNVEKFELSVEEYEKRDDNRIISSTSQVPSGTIISVGSSRGNPHKNNVERLNSVEVIEPPRRPVIANLMSVININNISNVDKQTNSSSNTNNCSKEANLLETKDKLGDGFSSLSINSPTTDNRLIDSEETGCGEGLRIGLNPNAKEFVPSSSRNDLLSDDSSAKKSSRIEIICPDTGLPVEFGNSSDNQETASFNCSGDYYDEFNFYKVVNDVSSAALMNECTSPTSGSKYEKEVYDILELIENFLINNPGLYSAIVDAVTSIFSRWSECEQTLKLVAQKIMKQSTAANNYSYIGAKICTDLDKLTQSNSPYVFRKYILSECEEEHENLENTLKSENVQHAHSVITFIAELYIQLVLKDGYSRIKKLGDCIIDSLNLLLADCTASNIGCLCKILKLSGWALEEDHPIRMKRLLDSLLAIKHSSQLATSGANMLNSVISLARSHWGRGPAATSTMTSSIATHNNKNKGNSNGFQQPEQTVPFEGVRYPRADESRNFYGDEVVFSDEELEFFNENCNFDDEFDCMISDLDCDMDDEVCEAYEQFLLTVPDVKRNTVNNIKK